MGYVPSTKSASPQLSRVVWGTSVAILFAVLGSTLVLTNIIFLGGLPFSVMARIWQDPVARSAYFDDRSAVLHDRIEVLGIEAELKAYYRDRISDPAQLDQQVQQILYDRTGYVGRFYRVNPQGQIVQREHPPGAGDS